MSLPGFSAEQSLTFTRMRYRIVGQPEYSPDMEHVSPQSPGEPLSAPRWESPLSEGKKS